MLGPGLLCFHHPIVRIHILSDLHREFGPTLLEPQACDLLLLAGDISTKQNALPWIREFSQGTPVAYICGNHEFYGDKLPRVTERLQAATKDSHIQVLENSHMDIHGWHIYGCTLWTDMAFGGDWQEGAATAGEVMNDYKKVRNSRHHYRRLTPRDTRAIHQQSLAQLDDFLRTHDPRRTVVMTHHAPSALSLPERRRSQLIGCAYASHLDHFVVRHQPAIWIHGHIHHSSDYWIGQTRIIANPQGYPEEPNENFNPTLLLDL